MCLLYNKRNKILKKQKQIAHCEVEKLLLNELESPIETVAKDLEAHAVALMVPSSKLLLIEGSLRYMVTLCSKRLPDLIF